MLRYMYDGQEKTRATATAVNSQQLAAVSKNANCMLWDLTWSQRFALLLKLNYFAQLYFQATGFLRKIVYGCILCIIPTMCTL